MIKEILKNEKQLLIITSIVIIIVLFAIYLPSINGKFVYDDSFYVSNNYYTKNLSTEGLANIWSNYIFGNYNPVTITSLAVDYKLFGYNTTGYHILNLLFHFLTIIAILFFVRKLTGNVFISIFSSLLFAIHPIHVESVSWISGRKDILFSLFFILSLFYYLKYEEGASQKKYILSLVLFILSCLSKAVAVTLPLILFIIDFLKYRKFSKQAIIEKIPFLIISVIIGIIAIDAQTQVGALRLQEEYGIFNKVVLSFHALTFYIGKILMPINLSANYAFPVLKNGFFDLSIYFSAFIFIIIAILSVYSMKYSRKIICLLAFFVITLLPVLQIVAVGNAITADRFAYLPSLSVLIFITGILYYSFSNKINKRFNKLKILLAIIVAIWFISHPINTYNRAKVWQNDIFLFSDMIEKNPNVPFYYNNLGLAYFEQTKNFDKAKMLFEKAIALKPNYSMAYNNLGNLYSDLNQKNKALQCYLKAIKYDSSNVSAYNNVGVIYLERDDIQSADYYLSKAYNINPNFFELLNNYATVLIAQKNYLRAKSVLQRALNIDRFYVKTYVTFALLLYEQGKINEAEEIILKALEIDTNNAEANAFLKYMRNPKSDRINENKVPQKEYLELSQIDGLIKRGKLNEAENSLKQFVKNYSEISEGYIKLAMLQANMNKYNEALKAFSLALKIEPGNVIILKNMAVVYQKSGNIPKVIECYQKAAKLGDLGAQEWLNLNKIKW